jgi:hypothetical protein
MGAFTDHSVMRRNENLFLWSPLTLALVPLGLMLAWGSPRAPPALRWICTALAALTGLGVLLKALPVFDQANWNLIALLAPMTLGLAAIQWLARRRPARPT